MKTAIISFSGKNIRRFTIGVEKIKSQKDRHEYIKKTLIKKGINYDLPVYMNIDYATGDITFAQPKKSISDQKFYCNGRMFTVAGTSMVYA